MSDDFFSMLVPSYFDINGCEIIVIQDAEGNLLTLKIVEYDN
tara:strand:- start:578 stop:703 length:126 start_codon:yes stop_codon:yes gene_type:complete